MAIKMKGSALATVACGLLAASACSDSGTSNPKPPPCSTSSGQAVNLTVGSYVALAPLSSMGCFLLPADSSGIDSAEYLAVPQLATDVEGGTASYYLTGGTQALAAAPPPPRAGAAMLTPAERFDLFLRQSERDRWYGAPPSGAGPAVREAAPTGPPTVGSTHLFSVCANLSCSSFTKVTATAKIVSTHLAIFVDNAAPTAGLDSADLDTLSTMFDSRLYPLDTTAFGHESDVDSNGVVFVLMTPVVNKMVSASECLKSGYIAGFFFGADLDPAYANDSRFNHGEVFYSIVADSLGTFSCSHSATQVKHQVPITFVHEFQHMISYNQHVLLLGGQAEVLWLNEGLSHFAEELGGRSFLPGDNTSFTRFVINDLFNGYKYLDSSGAHFLVAGSGIGTLAERGAAWLFVRYVDDQFRSDTSFAATAAFTRKLEATTLVGGANVAAATGTPFATLVEHWALANYVADLPGFTAPPELKYTSWHFRTTYASLNVQDSTDFPKAYPLTPPAGPGKSVALSGTLKAGSGVYALALQGPGDAGFSLFLSGPSGNPISSSLTPRLNLIRIR